MLSFLDRAGTTNGGVIDDVEAPEATKKPRLDAVRRYGVAGWHRSADARTWFRAFRRTRPFWGGLWLLVGGWLILRLSMVSLQVVVSAGLSGFGGWLTGCGLIICGLIAWAAPTQRYIAGLIGILLAVASLVLSNLGGMFVGMFFGIIGGAMVLSWGPKKAKKSRAVAETAEPTTEAAAHDDTALLESDAPTEEFATAGTVVDEPEAVVDNPEAIVEEPVVEDPVAQEPVVEEAVVEEPAPDATVASTPTPSKPSKKTKAQRKAAQRKAAQLKSAQPTSAQPTTNAPKVTAADESVT